MKRLAGSILFVSALLCVQLWRDDKPVRKVAAARKPSLALRPVTLSASPFLATAQDTVVVKHQKAVGNTFTIQNALTASTSACNGSGNCSTPSITTVAAGAVRLIGVWYFSGNCPASGSGPSSTNGDTWVYNPGSNGYGVGTYNSTIGVVLCMASVASSKGGSNDTVTWAITAHGVAYVDATYTGTAPTFSFTTTNATNASPYALIGFSCSANSLILQLTTPNSGNTYSSISGGYTATNGAGGPRVAAELANTSSCSAPSITYTGGTVTAQANVAILATQ